MPTPSDLFAAQRTAFAAHPFPSARERKRALSQLIDALLAHREPLAEAISQDFGGRSRHEVMFSEIYVSLTSLRHARSHVSEWMQKRYRPVAWPLQLAQAYVLPQPLGVVGIVAPWNYPVFLAIGPLAAALAAGNRVMLKPSEHTPRTSALLAMMISKTFAPDFVTVVEGDANVGKAFAALPFDHLLFTGSTAVGRDVMRAASENLTPVTLELGGKSPAIVAEDANLARAAEDIVYGKLINGGQTCIAPDYVLVAAGRKKQLVKALQAAVERLYPKHLGNRDYTSIIDERSYSRLKGYVEEARRRGVDVVTLGPEPRDSERRMAPTLILDPPDDLAVMREEIFGPILPVKPIADVSDAIGYINGRPRPLAIYLFTGSRQLKERVLQETVSGGVCLNDTLLQVAADDLPFGGAGASGMGHYHAQEGFDTFSKLKPVFERGAFGMGRMLRPPYSKLHEWMERLLIR